jgi:hypothetical protein
MQRSEILWNASFTARATDNHAEADAWAARAAELRGSDPSVVTSDDDLLDDPELLTLAVDSRELSTAVALVHHSPAEALARIAKISPELLFAPDVRAQTNMVTGMCQEKLGEHDAALAAFRLAMDHSGAVDVKQFCHWRAAAIHYSRREYGLAHSHLVACVRLFEAARTSFDDVEARMTFLRIGLIRHDRLIEVCLRLNLVAEALTAVQQIKSRALLDMLAQESHRPVDAAFEARAAGLRDEHEQWLTEFAAGTGPEGPAEEYLTSPRHRMLSGIVQNQKNTKALQEERDDLALFDRLVDEGAPLDFAAIRSLLAGWDSR